MNLENIEKFYNKYAKDVYLYTFSLCKDIQQLPQMGFENSKEYPYLELGTIGGGEYSSNIYEKHFKSLLKYMVDNKGFVNLDHPNVYTEVYEKSLNYVENNGVNSYGVLVSGNSESILKLRNESFVHGIRIDDIKISTYSH